MINASCNWENLSIYYTNLSPMYLCSSVFTALALFLTWWLNPRNRGEYAPDSVQKGYSKKPLTTSHCRQTQFTNLGDDGGGTVSSTVWNSIASKADAGNMMIDQSTMKHIKSVRQAAIEKELTAGLSEEQLIKEQETQATQLEAIYKLLKEKEDQFQIRSMDELQEQLKLYKT